MIRTAARAVLAVFVLFLAGTIGAAIQGAATELRRQEAADEAREAWQLVHELRDSIAALRHSCVDPRSSGHSDWEALAASAEAAGIPVAVYLGVLAVESGYSARYHLRGKHGEYGRVQIKYSLWRKSSPFCRRTDPGSQRACAAHILRAAYERYGSWRLAAAAYNKFSAPDTVGPYMALVEREIGRMVLRSIDGF